MSWKPLFFIVALIFLSACSSPNVEQYSNNAPKLELSDFFNGDLVAHGIVLDRSGDLTRSFTVKLKGTWQGNKGKLEEWFIYNDGEKQERTWYLEKTAQGYNGTAQDVIGTAQGSSAGNALFWQYQLAIEYQGRTINVTLDDWMYLVDEQVLINKTDISKFGFKVGEVVLSIRKLN